MSRKYILCDFFKRSILPVMFAILLYKMFIGICTENGVTNYIYLFALCGIPFGIQFMFLLPLFGNAGSAFVIFCFNIAIGSVIGGFILTWLLIVAIWYVPLTVVRFIKSFIVCKNAII